MSSAPPLWTCWCTSNTDSAMVAKTTAHPGTGKLWPFQWQQGWGGVGVVGKKWGQAGGFWGVSKKTFQRGNESFDPEKNSSLRKGNEARQQKGWRRGREVCQRNRGVAESWELEHTLPQVQLPTVRATGVLEPGGHSGSLWGHASQRREAQSGGDQASPPYRDQLTIKKKEKIWRCLLFACLKQGRALQHLLGSRFKHSLIQQERPYLRGLKMGGRLK